MVRLSAGHFSGSGAGRPVGARLCVGHLGFCFRSQLCKRTSIHYFEFSDLVSDSGNTTAVKREKTLSLLFNQVYCTSFTGENEQC